MARVDQTRQPLRYREVPTRSRSCSGPNDPGAEPALEQRLGKLFRAVGEPQALSAAELAEVRFRLAQRSQPSRAFVRFRELALVFACVLLGASVAFAGAGLLQLVSEPRTRNESHSDLAAGGPPAQRIRPRSERAVPPPIAASSEAKSISPQPQPATEGRQGPPRTGFEIEAAEPPISDQKQLDQRALTLESAALGRALTKLRRERDPGAALLLFDQYAAEFPNGALRLESRVARIDALLSLGRKSQALSELGELPLQRVARGAELRLLRAELWAERDCRRALADFEPLLDGSISGSIAERALHGRAVCRLQLGDRARALSDLQTYLQRYPSGLFANEIRASLSSGNLE